VDFHSSGLDDSRLPPPLETAVYRVVQEALTNVQRHAAAKRVSVVVRRLDEVLSVVVEDDGRGFNPEEVDNTRLGIVGMRERVVMFGGTLEVDSAPDRGTVVVVRIPFTEEPGRTDP